MHLKLGMMLALRRYAYSSSRYAALTMVLAALTLGLWPTARAYAHHDPLLQAALTRFLNAVYFGERQPDGIVKWPQQVKVLFGGTADAFVAGPLRYRLLSVLHQEISPVTGITFVGEQGQAQATLHIILSDEPLGDLETRYSHLFASDTEGERRKEARRLGCRVAPCGKVNRQHACAAKLYLRDGSIESAVLVFNMKHPRSLDICVNGSFLFASGFRQATISSGLLSVFTTTPPAFSQIDRDILTALYKDPRVVAGTSREQALPSLLDALLHPARQD